MQQARVATQTVFAGFYDYLRASGQDPVRCQVLGVARHSRTASFASLLGYAVQAEKEQDEPQVGFGVYKDERGKLFFDDTDISEELVVFRLIESDTLLVCSVSAFFGKLDARQDRFTFVGVSLEAGIYEHYKSTESERKLYDVYGIATFHAGAAQFAGFHGIAVLSGTEKGDDQQRFLIYKYHEKLYFAEPFERNGNFEQQLVVYRPRYSLKLLTVRSAMEFDETLKDGRKRFTRLED